jgi:hypothetical protein
MPAWILAFVAVIFLLICGIGLSSDVLFRISGVRADATVVAETGYGRNSRAILEYKVNGAPKRLTSIRGSGFYEIGDKYPVRYLADNPDDVREDFYLDFDVYWGVAGIILAIASGVVLVVSRLMTRASAG